MLGRKHQGILELVKKKIALGSSNIPGASAELVAKTILLRQIREKILVDKNAVINYFKITKLTDGLNELNLFDIFLHALLTEVFQTGRCGEHADVGVAEHLKHGINKSIEKTHIEGIDINGNPGQHALIVLDRNPQSNIENPATWCNVILFDTWWLSPSRKFSGDSHPGKQDLCFVMPQLSKISCEFRREKNLTSEEWKNLILFFENLDCVLFNTKQYKTLLKNLGCDKESRKSHIILLRKTLATHIEEFKRLAKSPHVDHDAFIIKHWENPPVYSPEDFTLFKRKPEVTKELAMQPAFASSITYER